jgi:hypothetical protein
MHGDVDSPVAQHALDLTREKSLPARMPIDRLRGSTAVFVAACRDDLDRDLDLRRLLAQGRLDHCRLRAREIAAARAKDNAPHDSDARNGASLIGRCGTAAVRARLSTEVAPHPGPEIRDMLRDDLFCCCYLLAAQRERLLAIDCSESMS